MTDVSTVPPFVVFQKPLFQFNTYNENNNSNSNSNNNSYSCNADGSKSPVKVSRIFFDEVANDVVIFSNNAREVCFYHVQLSTKSRDTQTTTTARETARETTTMPLHNQLNRQTTTKDDRHYLHQQEKKEKEKEEKEWLQCHAGLSGDAIALTIKGGRSEKDAFMIRHAKRCPTPLYETNDSNSNNNTNNTNNTNSNNNSNNRAYLVALSLDTRTVFFFLCHSQMSIVPISAVAVFQCAPKSLRFREDFYPIHAFYWAEELRSVYHNNNNNNNINNDNNSSSTEEKHTESQNFSTNVHTSKQQKEKEDKSSRENNRIPSSSFKRYLSNSTCPRRILLCITSISIDVVGVDEFKLPPISSSNIIIENNSDVCILLRRYTTHTDYWHYSPAARTLLSINKLKPYIIKTFQVTDDEGIRTLATLRLEEESYTPITGNETGDHHYPNSNNNNNTTTNNNNDNNNDSKSSYSDQSLSMFYSTACMDTPTVRYPVGFLVLYRNLFLCYLSRRDGSLVLFRYESGESNSNSNNNNNNTGGGGCCYRNNNNNNCNNNNNDNNTHHNSKNGKFVKYAILRPDFPLSQQQQQQQHEPISLQVVDNLIVLHAIQRGISSVFDILFSEETGSALAGITETRMLTSINTRETINSISMNEVRSSRESFFSFNTNNNNNTNTNKNKNSMESTGTQQEEFPRVSWITRLANNLLSGTNNTNTNKSNKSVHSSISRHPTRFSGNSYTSEDNGIRVLEPLLTASLALYNSVESNNVYNSIGHDILYSHAFVYGTLPVILDRYNGKIHLIGVNPFAIAATIPNSTQRLWFYLQRIYCAGRAVQSMLYAMLAKQENMDIISHAFTMITTHHAIQLLQSQQCMNETGKYIPSWMRESLSFGIPVNNGINYQCDDVWNLLGSTKTLRQWLCVNNTSEVSSLNTEKCLTLQDVLDTCMTSNSHNHNHTNTNTISTSEMNTCMCTRTSTVNIHTRMSIDQSVMHHDVFDPLVDTVLLPSMHFTHKDVREGPTTISIATTTTKTKEEESTMQSIESRKSTNTIHVNDSVSTGTLYFTRYLFYALMEYARCVMQTNDTLLDSLQRLLLRLLEYTQLKWSSLQQLLLHSGIITDQVPTAIILVRMGGKYRQVGFSMLSRLHNDALVVQLLLVERQPLDAVKYICRREREKELELKQQQQQSGEKLLTARLMGDILRCAMEAVLNNKQENSENCRNKEEREGLEFITVYETFMSWLLRQPLSEELLPPKFLDITAKYRQLLSEREKY